MTKSIFKSIFLTALTATIIVSVLITAVIFSSYENMLTKELRSESDYILHSLNREKNDIAYFEDFTAFNRVTLISPNGMVLYDSRIDAASLENHADRSEVADALKYGSSESKRFSSTFSETTFYFAVRTAEGNVLRLSNTRNNAAGLVGGILPLLGFIIICVGIFSFMIARGLSKNLIAPINSLDLDMPLENETYDELSPLLLRMERQRRELDKRMQDLIGKQNELSVITDNMHEGLILIGPQGDILLMNTSASSIFSADADEKKGYSFLTVSESPEVRHAISEALEGRRCEAFFDADNKTKRYRLIGSPVFHNDEIMGAALIIIDITDQYTAELSRREFTANVSHELKTPLTSISGYAEIMRDGVAKPEDTQKFSARIYDEANRLISLVNDILELSKLDEKKEIGQKEYVSLLTAAREAAARMSVIAEQNNIKIDVSGGNEIIEAYPHILDEMIGNLIENAVKYNVAGGRVTVKTGKKGDKKTMSVSDTGIGIAPKHQARIFERFYRINKSRSRESGGTGLGLSIVKHGAEIHGADISIDSRTGRGTTITVTFND